MPGGDITIQAATHPSGNWITIPIMLGGSEVLRMVLDTGSPVSALSPSTAERLLHLRLIRDGERGRYGLTPLTSDGQPLPDLEVRVLPRLDRLGIVGLVGLDFLMRFRRIDFDVEAFRLTLADP